MRIPLPVAILLCLITVGLIGWLGTRSFDFLTPPSEAKLNKIREDALASLPASRIEEDAISIKVTPADIDVSVPEDVAGINPEDLGDITSPPNLDSYSERAPEGSGKLLALASALEKAGAFQRALLAYERVLDLSESNAEQIESAVTAILRLKPTLPDWNPDSEKAAPAVIHIGTGGKYSKMLPAILDGITRDLNSSSSGIVRFSHEIHIGRTIQTVDAPTPVALWITGAGDDPISTDVLSFTTDDPETLRNDLIKTSFNLIRGHLTKSASYNPAPEALDDPLSAMNSHITRLLWSEFGKSLVKEP